MKRAVRVSAFLVAGLLLAGCSATTAQSVPTTNPSTSPTPTVDPGPVQLTKEDAAIRYLQIVCPGNIATQAWADAITPLEDEWVNGGSPDLTALAPATQRRIDTSRNAIELFDDTYFAWPEEVADLMPAVRDSYMGDLGPLSQVLTATRMEDLNAVAWPAQESPAQEIRYQLGLDVDTAGTCVGHENGHELLLAEKTEREAAEG